VRARLDELASAEKRPMFLFVRVPPSVTDCMTAGLEVERWISEGLVDLVSPAQIMTLAGDMPIANLVSLGRKHGVAIHPSLYPRTSWRLPFPPPGATRYADTKVSRDATLEEIRGAAANYRAMGADGFYLFNFYNAFGSARPHDDRLNHVFRDLARPENLPGQPVVYAITKSYYQDGPGSYAYGKQLPAKLAADGTLRLTLDVAENVTVSPYPLRACDLRIGFRALPADGKVTITLNGATLETSERFATRQLVKTVPRQPDLAEDYLHFTLPGPESLIRGTNTFVVVVAGGKPSVEVTDLEVRYDYQNDLDQIWHRTRAQP
jgi:hypothetical protein